MVATVGEKGLFHTLFGTPEEREQKRAERKDAYAGYPTETLMGDMQHGRNLYLDMPNWVAPDGLAGPSLLFRGAFGGLRERWAREALQTQEGKRKEEAGKLLEGLGLPADAAGYVDPGDVYKAQIGAQIKANAPTDLMRNLQAAGIDPQSPQGRALIEQSIRKPQTQISMGPEENAWAKGYGELQVKQLSQALEEGAAGNDELLLLDRFEQLMSQPNVDTGQLQALVTTAQGLFSDIAGVDVPGLGEREALRALSNQFALKVAQQSKGSTSDRDMEIFLNSVPALRNSPEGNKLIIDLARTISERKVQRASMAEDYADQNEGLRGFEDQWRNFINTQSIFQGKPASPVLRDIMQLPPGSKLIRVLEQPMEIGGRERPAGTALYQTPAGKVRLIDTYSGFDPAQQGADPMMDFTPQ